MWIVQAVSSLLYNSLLEFVLFVLVDIIAKTPLRDARSQEEKRTIWLYESLLLAVISLIIYLFDHFPYFLFLFTTLTFVYTQLCGRVDFRYWWNLIKTRWEEHQQHTENLKLIEENQRIWKVARKNVQNCHALMQACTVNDTSRARRYRDAIWSKTKSLGQYLWKPKDSVMPQAVPLEPNKIIYNPVVQNIQQSKPIVPSQRSATPIKSSSSSWFGRNELRRRPLRAVQTSTYSPPQTISGTSQKMRTKFLSAFGLNDGRNRPAGLRNEGQNLCFLNCVVQGLSRSPKLVEHLTAELKSDIDCSVAESVLLSSLVDLLSKCRSKTGAAVIDSSTFRQAVSVLNPDLVVNGNERQYQQDAAEFFMWLMQVLHNVLSKKTDKVGEKKKLEAIPALAELRFIYGDLSPARLGDLKEACRNEISQANGLDNNSYAEPIQRLSDLEWLSYKQKNHSVLDNAFTGQLVEAFHCLTDNHLTVNTQTFNILPVPIVSPRDVSGLVFLEDCFTKFCNIEHLIGQEGLECSICNKALSSPILPSNSVGPVRRSQQKTPVLTKQRFSSVDSAIHSPQNSANFMSPIPGQRDFINDSGFHDNVFKTSTPIRDQATFPTQRLRDAQRRCLLRQLPDCLVIQMLRFTFNQYSQQSRKITAPVSIPLKNLDMTNIVYDNVTNREDMTASHSSFKYNLYAVCVHLGAEATNCGHYICYCQNEDGQWYKFDDELVMEVNMEYEITTREIRENAYLLFYKRATAADS